VRDGQTDILVIDDDPWIVELVIMAAEERGWHVQSAADGTTGLRGIDQFQPRLVLLDVRLPRQDGWSILREIKERFPHDLPVIMMTANTLDEDREVSNQATAIIRKPFAIQPFLDLMAHHLS
jgi:DNA-binding response OmpR family regulator